MVLQKPLPDVHLPSGGHHHYNHHNHHHKKIQALQRKRWGEWSKCRENCHQTRQRLNCDDLLGAAASNNSSSKQHQLGGQAAASLPARLKRRSPLGRDLQNQDDDQDYADEGDEEDENDSCAKVDLSKTFEDRPCTGGECRPPLVALTSASAKGGQHVSSSNVARRVTGSSDKDVEPEEETDEQLEADDELLLQAPQPHRNRLPQQRRTTGRRKFPTAQSPSSDRNAQGEFNYDQRQNDKTQYEHSDSLGLRMINNNLTTSLAAAGERANATSRTTNYEQFAEHLGAVKPSATEPRLLGATHSPPQLDHSSTNNNSDSRPSIWPIQLFGLQTGGRRSEFGAYLTSRTYPASALVHWTLLIGSLLSLILIVALLVRKLLGGSTRLRKSSYKWMLDRHTSKNRSSRGAASAAAAGIQEPRLPQVQTIVRSTEAMGRQHGYLQRRLLLGRGTSSKVCTLGARDAMGSMLQLGPDYKGPAQRAADYRKLADASGRLLVDMSGRHRFVRDDDTSNLLQHHQSPAISSKSVSSSTGESSSAGGRARATHTLETLLATGGHPIDNNYDVPDYYHCDDRSLAGAVRMAIGHQQRQQPVTIEPPDAELDQSPRSSIGEQPSSGQLASADSRQSMQSSTVQMLSSSFEQLPELLEDELQTAPPPPTSSHLNASSRRARYKSSSSSSAQANKGSQRASDGARLSPPRPTDRHLYEEIKP